MVSDEVIEELLKQAVFDSVIYLPECGCPLEPDGEMCPCGNKNPLKGVGYL